MRLTSVLNWLAVAACMLPAASATAQPAHAGHTVTLVVPFTQDVGAVLALPAVRAQLAAQGLVVQTGSSEQLGSLLRADLARWRKVIADAKITAD